MNKTFLQLQGFHNLVRSSEWAPLKEMISKYKTIYVRHFGKDSAHYNSNEGSVINGIKYLNSLSNHFPSFGTISNSVSDKIA